MRVNFSAAVDRLRANFLFIPALFSAFAVAFALFTLALDDLFVDRGAEFPFVSGATVDSARAVLTTVAMSTIGIAGITFSVSLLLIQLASSQYSPRIVHALLRDPFGKRVIGVVLGTFTYCLVVLRSVRDSEEVTELSTTVVPALSVTIAGILGIVAVMATVAFINHSAHAMDISELLNRVTRDTVAAAKRDWVQGDGDSDAHVPEPPAGEGFVVRFAQHGWVQEINTDVLLANVPAEGAIRLDTAVGRFAVPGAPLCTVWPEPSDEDALVSGVHNAVHVGKTRTMQQDASYGLRQLVDVTLRALSTGVNDPTTAQDAIFHTVAVLHEVLVNDEPRKGRSGPDGQWLYFSITLQHATAISLAFDEVRLAAADQPAVCIYLLEAMSLLRNSLGDEITDEIEGALADQAQLVLDGCAAADVPAHDVDRVRTSYRKNFGSAADQH